MRKGCPVSAPPCMRKPQGDPPLRTIRLPGAGEPMASALCCPLGRVTADQVRWRVAHVRPAALIVSRLSIRTRTRFASTCPCCVIPLCTRESWVCWVRPAVVVGLLFFSYPGINKTTTVPSSDTSANLSPWRFHPQRAHPHSREAAPCVEHRGESETIFNHFTSF